jgi:hypothetical protein
VFFERVDPETSPDRRLGHVVSTASSNTIEIEAVKRMRIMSLLRGLFLLARD